MEYFLQRMYLLRSIEELLTQSGSKDYAQCTATTVKQALDADLEAYMLQALSISLSHGTDKPSANSSDVRSSPVPYRAMTGSEPHTQHRQSVQAKQQLVNEQEMLLSLTLSLYSIWRPCKPDAFQKLSKILDDKVLKASNLFPPMSKTACLVRMICLAASDNLPRATSQT